MATASSCLDHSQAERRATPRRHGWGGEPDLEAAIRCLVRRQERGRGAESAASACETVEGYAPADGRARPGGFAPSCPRARAPSPSTTRCRVPEVPEALRWLSPMTVRDGCWRQCSRTTSSRLASCTPSAIAPRPLISQVGSTRSGTSTASIATAGGRTRPSGRSGRSRHRWPRRRARRLRETRDRIPRRMLQGASGPSRNV